MSTNLERALGHVATAIDADSNQDYPVAYKQYCNAIEYILLCLQYEKNEKSKQILRQTIKDYKERAEALIHYLGRHSIVFTNLDRAIEIVTTAIEADIMHDHLAAYKLYFRALDYFMLALRDEKNEESKILLRTKIQGYITRAEATRDFLQEADERKAQKAICCEQYI